MRKLSLVVMIILLLIACSKKDAEKPKDNITAKKNIAPLVAETKDINIDEGNKYLMNGNFDKAIDYYNRALAENRAVAFYNLGVATYLLGKYPQSEEYFRKAIAENKNFRDAYINLAATLIKLKKIDEAVEVISSIAPERTVEYQLYAEIYTIAQDYPKAYYYYEKFANAKDPSPLGLVNYGLFLKNMGEDEKASMIINNAIKKIESNELKEYEDFYQLAVAYFSLQNYDKAIYYGKSAVNLKKTYEVLEILLKAYEHQGKYDLAALTAEDMLSINQDISTYIIYIKDLIRSASYKKAEDVLKNMLVRYPGEKEFYFLYHNLALFTGDTDKADYIARNGFKKIRDEEMAYFYARQSILYFNNVKEAGKAFSDIKNKDYINILNAFAMLKKNNISGAQGYLNKVSNQRAPDYNFAEAYINLYKKNYTEASKYADMMDDTPEKFFYKFVIYYNTKDFDSLSEIVKKNAMFIKNIKRYPNVHIRLVPIMEDLKFAFSFDGSFESYMRFVLTPIFINPEEVTSYLGTGYNLLKQSDPSVAISELSKSVTFSEGIRHNNNGVKAILNFDYENARKELEAASNYLQDNPVVSYNLGILMLNLGSVEKAYNFFDTSVLTNRFTFPAYLGKAICLRLMDEDKRISSQYELLLSNYSTLENSDKKQALPFYYTKLFALAGLGRYEEINATVKDSDPHLYKSIKYLADFMRNGDYNSFVKAELSFHRGDTLKAAMSMFIKNKILHDFPHGDRLTDYTLYNIAVEKGIKYELPRYNEDRYLLAEHTRYDIYFNKNDALNKLKKLTQIDKKDPALFKLSLYYFTLMGDVINAEISLQNLKKYGMDKTGYYYQMLYHFLTNNSFNINKSISKYIEIASDDYRGYMVELLKGFRENNLSTAYDDAIRLSKANLRNKKIPLEIDVYGF